MADFVRCCAADADGTKLLGLPSGAEGEDASLLKLPAAIRPACFEGVPYLENVDGYAYVLFGRDEKDFDGAVYKLTEHNRPNKNAETAGTSIRKST